MTAKVIPFPPRAAEQKPPPFFGAVFNALAMSAIVWVALGAFLRFFFW